MSWYPIQDSFSGGEISPELASQIGSDIYQRGVRTMKNMYTTHVGAATTRPGFEYIDTVLTGYEGNARVVPVDLGVEQRTVLVLTGDTDGSMDNSKIYTFSEQSFDRKGQLVKNSDFSNGLNNWVVIEQVNNAGASVKSHNYGDPVQGNGEFLDIFASMVLTNNQASLLVIEQQVYVPPHEGDMVLRVVVGGDLDPAQGSRHLFTLQIILEDGSIPYSLPFEQPLGRVDAYDGVATFLAGYEGLIKVRMYVDTDPAYPTYQGGSIGSIEILYDEPASETIAPVPTPYRSDELKDIQFVQNPYDNSVVFVHPDHEPSVYRLALGTASFSIIDWIPPGGSSTGPHWTENPLPEDGYPRACGASAGRLILGGTRLEPQGVWATPPGLWDVIERPADPTTATALHYTMTTLGYMQWIMGGPRLLHGTSNGEHTITGIVAGTNNELDIQVNENSTNGSAHVQAERVGYQVMYAEGARRNLMSMAFSDENQVFRTDNMNLASGHINRGRIIRIAYARDPFKIVWCVLDNGTMTGMSFDPGTETSGWHQHDTPGGYILDAGEGRLDGVDRLYVLVRRTIDGVTRLQLEAMRTYDDDLVVAMDNYTTQSLDDTYTEVTGMERWGEGAAIWVQTQTQLFGPLTITDGKVELPEPVARWIAVGQAFDQELETMPAAPGAGRAGSNSLGSSKTFSRIGLRLYESGLPLVNGIKYKQKEGLDENRGFTTHASGELADYAQHHVGWDELEPIKITQNEPLKTTITGIFGKLTDRDL